MAKAKRSAPTTSSQSDYVSIWFWLLTIVLMFVPIVNLVAIITFAFVGENRSRKNFFRALLCIPLIAIGLHFLLFLIFLLTPGIGQGTSDLWTATVQVCKDVWVAILELIPKTGTK
jgi:ABC-type sugar transport system permease subunit